MNGRIDPHVFARFQNVSLDVDFDFTLFINPRGVRSIRIDMNHIVNVDDCEHFERVLRQTTIFRDLKVILSHSPTIKHLVVVVKVAVHTDWAGVKDPQLRSDPLAY
jgi:5'(3')-deoxyribonucleotidase